MTKFMGRAGRWWLTVSTAVCALGPSLLFGCGGREHATPYAAAVFDDPPIYCYRTIGDADCYKEPLPGAERRLVNYYGPPPGDYEWPEPPPAPRLDAPPPGRPIPSFEAVPVLVPGPTPDSRPTLLYPPKPSTADPAPDAETSAVPASTAKPTTVAGSAKPASAVSAATPAMSPPAPRPAAAASTPAPLVIEVEGQ